MVLKKLFENTFLKNISVIAVGTGLSQLVALISAPIISKLYLPSEIGIFATFLSISTIISSVAAGRYDIAIPSVVDKEKAANLFALSFIFLFIICSLIFISFFIFKGFIESFIDIHDLSILGYFLPISVFFMTAFNILTFANNREGNYKDIAISNIVRSSVLSIAQVLLGIFKMGFIGLILSTIISSLSGNLRLMRNIRDYLSLIKISKIKEVAYEFRKFLILSSPGALMDSVSLNIIHILNAKVFGIEMAGFFYFSYRIFSLPLSLIGNSISQVYYKEISFNRKTADKIFFKTIKILFILCCIILCVEIIFLEFVWDSIFGSRWEMSKTIGFYLAFATIFQLIVSPVSTSLLVSNNHGFLTSWQVLKFFSVLMIYIFASYLSLSLESFMIIFTFTYLFLYAVYLFLIYRSVKIMSYGG